MDLKESDLVDVETHWYYQAKLVPFKRNLKKYSKKIQRTIDIGAGSGFFAKSLTDFDDGGTAICVDPNYSIESTERNGSLIFVREIKDPSADLYLFVDVLEHVEDDLMLLKRYTTNAPGGALIMISVPAFQSLWSSHDEFLGHFRRYRFKQFKELIEKADLQIIQCNYIFGLIFPIAWFVRKLRRTESPSSDLSPIPRPFNWLLLKLLKIEHHTSINKLVGLSLFAVARVPIERQHSNQSD
jgi:hypothetical protein